MDRLLVRTKTTGQVSLVYPRLLFEHVAALGENPERFLGESWPDMNPNQLGRYSLERLCELLLKASRRLEDPLLGLHVGQRIRLAHMGVLGYVLLNCETLGAAIERMLRYHRLVNDHTQMKQSSVGHAAVLSWDGVDGRPGALFDEMGITALVHFARDISSKPLTFIEVCFINPPPTDKRPYERFFGCPVRFSERTTRVVFAPSVLELPLRQPDPLLRQVLEEQVERLLEGLPRRASLEEAVRRVVMRLALDGEPSLQHVADELQLSTRVLYRRLASEHLNFRKLRDQALQSLAEQHLADARLSLSEVALLLGYSEQSAFTRAFKRWTGNAPSVARSLFAGTLSAPGAVH